MGTGADREGDRELSLAGPAAPLDNWHRRWLGANLIRLSEWARQKDVAISVVANWRLRYEGFPEPVLPPDLGGTGAVYWRPELEAFAARNGLPDARYKTRPPGSYAGHHHWKDKTT